MKKIFISLILLLASNASSETCIRYFQSYESNQQKILEKIEEIFKPTRAQVRIIRSFDLNEQYYMLKALKQVPVNNIKKTFNLIKKEPESYKLFGRISNSKILADILKPGYAKESFLNFKKHKFYKDNEEGFAFKSDITPTAEEKNYLKIYNKFNDFYNDEKKVFLRLQELESEVVYRVRLRNSEYESLGENKKYFLKEKELVGILEDYEIAHGFASISKGEYKPYIVTKIYKRSRDFYNLLRKGTLFNDKVFLEETIPSVSFGRVAHGYYTHRVQWNLLMREIDDHPRAYGRVATVDIYKKIGDIKFNNKINSYNKNDSESFLWSRLFDNVKDSFHSPEEFRGSAYLHSELGVWR